ncbi:Flavin mononucleotide hydrolase 1, chloroplatic [Glycine max]|nr:Flavin mononucleotide hydrolase 1, chloroplatic [Glycine max]
MVLMGGVGVPSISICCLFQTRPTRHLCLKFRLKPSLSHSITSMALTNNNNTNTNERKLPILLFDIMDTLVRDPFYQDVPAFFGMSLKELIDCKHPTAWIEFEKGLKSCMRSGYSYIEGSEQLLLSLKQNNYEMHAFTNYPIWYQLIEDKLKLSKYLSWTFCSWAFGKRKPDTEFYKEVVRHLKVDPTNCIFVDDRQKNVEAAIEVGIRGVHFQNVNSLCEKLSLMGIDISTDEDI